MSMNLQLDNAAIDRLIGGDTEIEIELRNCIVQEFAKKHLKAVAADPAFMVFCQGMSSALIDMTKEAIKKHVGEMKSVGAGWQNNMVATIPQGVQNRIRELVDSSMHDLITSRIEEMTSTLNHRFDRYEKNLHAQMEKRIAEIQDAQINAAVKERVSAILAGLNK